LLCVQQGRPGSGANLWPEAVWSTFPVPSGLAEGLLPEPGHPVEGSVTLTQAGKDAPLQLFLACLTGFGQIAVAMLQIRTNAKYTP